ncbi:MULTISPECIES: STM3941 family protein [unclassified Enterococcus]|uniref:STM3941 family protein n=1 Tax=unclassified Enterococcus TaxID=2608891 RepID=UPI0015540D86|nr:MULTISPECIES: STM3941 family protein [unclassified Enterococcus]MBS7578347.1 hypothetical protein [Enterococcus sp. MMGLQ5-2]MBS7585584.1 hypothetical protein [Enterococcus sp. MMGLQ5-1]NPD13443.1 hypothetical protein [Enterococcus sp. MMGLQ5-1]NPD38178.1 hypothetical protein [Enterococcus sp. MMGLQ5-2]
MANEFVVYQSKLKQVGLSFLGFIMVFMSLLVCLGGLLEHKYLLIIIGLVGFIFFGMCEAFIVKQVFKGKKLVILNSKGFFDYSSALATKDMLIPWSSIYKIENKSMINQQFVSIYLRDSESFLQKLSSLQKKAIQANIKMGFGEINITLQSSKKCTNEQLIEKMNQFKNEKLRIEEG